MKKIIMLLESIKNSNYIIEENLWGIKELILKDNNGEKCLLIEFNTEVNHNYLWKIVNDPFDLYEFLGDETIEEKNAKGYTNEKYSESADNYVRRL